MKFSEYMLLMIILKVTKKQGFNLSLENTLLEKPQEWVKLNPLPSPPLVFLRLNYILIKTCVLGPAVNPQKPTLCAVYREVLKFY